MSHKVRIISNSDAVPCEKYMNRMQRQEMFPRKNSPAPNKPYQEKISQLGVKQSNPVQTARAKSKFNNKQQNPVQKSTAQMMYALQKEHDDNETRINKEHFKEQKPRHRSRSRDRPMSKEREAWANILQSNKSREKISSFSNFDPLRTLHFLSKELFTKLHGLIPSENGILDMVSDIQHALKRIPPEVSTFLHNPQAEYPQSEISSYTAKSMSNKTCQTPPTLYQEDTEKFQKIMEENTYRLEASCKQLELVCTNLQTEKEMTEKELDEARENVEVLCKRVKELEEEIEEISNLKIRQLEHEKQYLQEELDKATQEVNDNPTINHLKKLVEELKKQKKSSDESRARLEYDMTLLKMEKEKFVTMLAVRDREIKDIQGEMSKIEEQVNKQLKKLNGEVVKRSASVKAFSDPLIGTHENIFLEIGDTTISSITSNESDRDPINIIKESPCGDAEVDMNAVESKNALIEKLKANNVEIELPDNNREDAIFEELLKGLTPSVKALLASHNL